MSADNLLLLFNTWYATLRVPERAREKLGRSRFKQSLKTGDKRKAQELARPVVAMWKAQIRQAEGEPDAVQTEALRWREALAMAKGEDLSTMGDVLTSRAEAIEARKGTAAAQEFASVALGTATPSTLHRASWAASRVHLEQKTQDQACKDVDMLLSAFSTLQGMTPPAVRAWAKGLTNKDGTALTPSSIKRMVSFWRSYWKHLIRLEEVPAGSDPFALVEVPQVSRKVAAASGWIPFPQQAVPGLIRAAMDRDDQELADLITLGAYTGARIEELCALKLASVNLEGNIPSFRIEDAKTEAGVREVPIHPALVPLVRRLKATSEGKNPAPSEYLLAGLTFNKYGDRSNAIGKRFGRLKGSLGFGRKHVFHSLRKTLVTALENAGVSENLAADIVGHEKPRITYGLYSGGASLEVKAKALAKVGYPGL